MKAFWEVFLAAYVVAWLLLFLACGAWQLWKIFKEDDE